jgi:hypothetical protein
MHRIPLAVGVFVWALVAARPAHAQTPEISNRPVFGRLTFAGDATSTISPSDTDAYFNFTNYDQNALRAAQVRVMGEFRVSSSLALLGEFRAENGDGLEGAAWYVRWHPSNRTPFDVQAGRIPPVIGLFAREPYGRDNPLIGAPLAYQYLLSLRPDALPLTAEDLVRMRGRGWEPTYPVGADTLTPGVPIVSAFRWDTGIEAQWHPGWLSLAGAVTRGAASVPAVRRDDNTGGTWSGRAAVGGTSGLTVGVSGARGPWIDAATLSLVPLDDRHDDTQTIIGADVEYGWGAWLIRGEELRSVFELPIIDAASVDTHLATWTGYVEARYRLRPRWQIAGRVEHLNFSTIADAANGENPITWEAPVKRVSADIGYRATRRLECRIGLQVDWRDGGRVTHRAYPAAQVLYWF